MLLLIVIGALIWLCERRRNSQQFGTRGTQGVAEGFWWAAVTMTTVGYGDKAPVTLGGSLIAIIWMFASMFLVATFTAAITTALTVSKLQTRVAGPAALSRVRVGTVQVTTSADLTGDSLIACLVWSRAHLH